MQSYKGWTAEQRMASLKLTKQAIASGAIPKPHCCNRCGQTAGIIDYHNEDYSHPTKYLEQLCFVCHMVHHSDKRNPVGRRNYFIAVDFGYQHPPVFSRNIYIIDPLLNKFKKGEL